MTHPSMYVPLSIKEAGLLDWVSEFVWPSDVGPFEEAFRIAEFGSFFLTGGMANTILFVASCLGFSLQNLGRLIDNAINVHSLKDLAGKDQHEIIAQLTGDIPGQPITSTNYQEFEAEFVKLAGLFDRDEDDMNALPETEKVEEPAGKAPKTKKEPSSIPRPPIGATDQELEEYHSKVLRENKRNEYARQRAQEKEESGILNVFRNKEKGMFGKNSPKKFGALTESIERVKARGGVWSKFLPALLIVVGWVIETVTRIATHPWDNKFEIAKAAGKMAASKAIHDSRTKDIAEPKEGSATANVLDQTRGNVFKKEPQDYASAINLKVSQIISGVG